MGDVTETSPRVARLLRELRNGSAGVLDDFWQEVEATGTPLVEAAGDGSALVTFLWRGESSHVAAGWGVDVTLQPCEGTDLWYGTQRLPVDLRTIYYIWHSKDTFPRHPEAAGPSHIDSLNPRRVRFPPDRSDPNDYPAYFSLVELPGAPEETWSVPQHGVARGQVLTTSLRTCALGGRRRIAVYRPAGKPAGPLPLLVVFDGFLSRAVLRIPTTLDNLIAAGRIPPTMALFVNAPSGERRERELCPRPAIRDFLVRELLPWARRRWSITDDPSQRVIAGASMGGLAASYVGMVASHEFGCVLSQSGSYWWPLPPAATEPEWLTRAFASRPNLPLQFYLDIGHREIINPLAEGLDMLAVNQRFRDVLIERGYPLTYAEYTGGHDYVNWRRTFADGLLALLGQPAVPAESRT